MELIVIVILFVGTLSFIYFNDLRKEKAEKERFREFVLANKAKSVQDYAEVLPSDEKFEMHQEDELIDLDQMTPEELLDIKQKEYGNIQGSN